MAERLCFQCFKVKGPYEMCPYCGYAEQEKAEQAFQLSPGTVLHDRYILGVCIGVGGFGITYKAFDSVLGSIVAVKEFYPAGLVSRAEGQKKVSIFSGEKREEFSRQIERFKQEALNMAIFSDEPDIIHVDAIIEENQTAYIIMEYVDAPLLKEQIAKEGRFSQQKAAVYILAILNALSKVHKQKIIHKDVSPDNIFLTGPDTIKLFDFGAAKFQQTETERTVSKVVKAGYTPPEQYSSQSEQGFYMDIYAVGAVFYEMVTGKRPIDAYDRKSAGIKRDALVRPRQLNPDLDSRMERVILKAMALKPQLRFQSAQEFVTAVAGSKKVLLPEEEMTRRKWQKRLMAAGAAAVAFAAGGIVVLNMTVFSSRGRIDMSKVQETDLTVWLSVPDEETGEKMKQTLLQSVEKECPQIHVEAEAILTTDYAKKAEQAARADSLPDVFCTDGLMDADYCEKLTPLFNTLILSDYAYLEELEEGELVSLPTAVQIGIVYVNTERTDTSYAEQNGVLLSSLPGAGTAVVYADEADALQQFQTDKEYGRHAELAGDLSDLAQVEEVTVKEVPSTDFMAFPVITDADRLVGHLEKRYGVKKGGDGNRTMAGMAVLSLMLSDGMQSVSYMGNGAGIPLNKEIMEIYRENKLTTYLSSVNEYDLDDAVLYEGDSMCSILKSGGNMQ